MASQELRGSDRATSIRARAAGTAVFFLCNHTAGQTWALLLNGASPDFTTGQSMAADFNLRDS